MKSVLISIQPKYFELITSGKKTIEVRKTAPKLQKPFKCYIYCTQSQFVARKSNGEFWFAKRDTLIMPNNSVQFSGKVIGEFVCDRIDSYIKEENNRYWWTFCSTEEIEEIKEKTRLTIKELVGYTGDSKHLYGWHISDLKIYNTPKGLGEFNRFIECENRPCFLCKYSSRDCNGILDCDKRITRPFQSWGYVEEL